jgi:hypothetical protein
LGEPTAPPVEEGTPAPTGEPTPTADTTKLEERLAALEQENQNLGKRLADTQTAFHGANSEGRLANEIVGAYQQAQQREREAYEQARFAQQPTIEDPEQLADPEKLRDFVQANAQWAAAYAAAHNQPVLASSQRQAGVLEQLAATAHANSFREAKAALEGMGFDDFDEFKDSIRATFEAAGDDGKILMMNPDNIQDAYVMARRAKGLPFNVAAKEAPPPPTPVRSRVSVEEAKRISPMGRAVMTAFGVDEKLDESDLEILEGAQGR